MLANKKTGWDRRGSRKRKKPRFPQKVRTNKDGLHRRPERQNGGGETRSRSLKKEQLVRRGKNRGLLGY